MSHRAADSRRHDPLRPTSSCHVVDGCIFLIITSLGNICQNICHKCTQDVKIYLPGVYEKTSLNFNSMDLSKSISHKCTQEHLPAVFIDTTYETAAAIINSTTVTYLAKHKSEVYTGCTDTLTNNSQYILNKFYLYSATPVNNITHKCTQAVN